MSAPSTDRLDKAIEATRADLLELYRQTASQLGDKHAGIFSVHLMLLDDVALRDELHERIAAEKINAEYLLEELTHKYAEIMGAVDDPRFRERTADLLDVADRILHNLLAAKRPNLRELDKPCIVVAHELSPSDTATMNLEMVQGLVLDSGSVTSHSAILARALEIPAIMGLADARTKIENGTRLAINGSEGFVVIDPAPKTQRQYRALRRRLQQDRATLEEAAAAGSCATLDGIEVPVQVNIELPIEIEHCIKLTRDGIGLYRTEYLFLNRTSIPSEDEQYEAYAWAAKMLAPAPVTLRTIDIGGDKFVAHLQISKEDNPQLGWRAVRFCLARPDIFKAQLRAMLRASVHGNVRIMFPMISGVEELRQVRAILEDVRHESYKRGCALRPQNAGGQHDRSPCSGGHRGFAGPGMRLFQHRHQRPHPVFAGGGPHQPPHRPSLRTGPSGRAPHDRAYRFRRRRGGHPVRTLRRDGRRPALHRSPARAGRHFAEHVVHLDTGHPRRNRAHQPRGRQRYCRPRAAPGSRRRGQAVAPAALQGPQRRQNPAQGAQRRKPGKGGEPVSVARKRLVILGATGSIGCSALEVARHYPERFEVVALAARGNVARLAEQIREFHPRHVAVSGSAAAAELRAMNLGPEILDGPGALEGIAAVDADIVLCAVVGAVGLRPLLRAIDLGRRVAIANKEPFVMAGPLVMERARAHGAEVLPVDSEHNAIFQCLEGQDRRAVQCVHLTASGGPFYRRDHATLKDITPEEAANHPTWDMGAKVSVDSATLMNKGLETIEAMHLFDLPAEKIQVIIHPQSVVHSLVEFTDGHILAHLGVTRMTAPILFALTWPERVESPMMRLDLTAMGELSFAAPDFAQFPCLALAREAALEGGTAPAILNAANEEAVAAFCARRIGFLDIAEVVRGGARAMRGAGSARHRNRTGRGRTGAPRGACGNGKNGRAVSVDFLRALKSAATTRRYAGTGSYV